MKRDILQYLKEWKNRKNRNPLILRGARQVGKTYIIEEFDFSEPFSEVIHNQISQFLRLYIFIGGMPEVVKAYAEDNKLTDIQRIHHNILTSIQYDFAKYGTRKQQEYLQTVLKYCGQNPGRKIKYSNIDKDTRSTFLKESIRKLELSRIVHTVKHTNAQKVPLASHSRDDVYKTIFLDIGFVNHFNQIDLIDLENLVTPSEGILAEQFTGQELLAQNEPWMNPQLYYWSREEKNSNAETDYIFQHKNQVYPVEVKAGKTGTLKSMQLWLYEKKLKTGIRFNMDCPSIGNFTTGINIQKKKCIVNMDTALITLVYGF